MFDPYVVDPQRVSREIDSAWSSRTTDEDINDLKIDPAELNEAPPASSDEYEDEN